MSFMLITVGAFSEKMKPISTQAISLLPFQYLRCFSSISIYRISPHYKYLSYPCRKPGCTAKVKNRIIEILEAQHKCSRIQGSPVSGCIAPNKAKSEKCECYLSGAGY